MGRLGKLRGFGVLASSAILGAYGYDELECWKIHHAALQKASTLGEEPLSATASLSQERRLILYYTCRNSFHHQIIASSFSKYAGNYLTRAGIDYELHQFILSKAQFPTSQVHDKDAMARELYSSAENYAVLMEGIQPEKYQIAWQRVKNAPVLCALSSDDSVYSKGRMFVIPCEQSSSFAMRLFKQVSDSLFCLFTFF
jgi:hypothetical protein